MTVAVDIELDRGRVSGTVIRSRRHSLRVKPGPSGIITYVLVLVAIDGEPEPRWVAAERVPGVWS